MRVINALATVYNTPFALPHITLAKGPSLILPVSEVIAKTHQLASTLLPCTVSFGEVGSGKAPFQVFYQKVVPTPGFERAQQAFTDEFGAPPGAGDPHMSLAYGDLSAEQVDVLRHELRVFFPNDSLRGATVTVDAVEIWDTPEFKEGDDLRQTVRSWEFVERISFGG